MGIRSKLILLLTTLGCFIVLFFFISFACELEFVCYCLLRMYQSL